MHGCSGTVFRIGVGRSCEAAGSHLRQIGPDGVGQAEIRQVQCRSAGHVVSVHMFTRRCRERNMTLRTIALLLLKANCEKGLTSPQGTLYLSLLHAYRLLARERSRARMDQSHQYCMDQRGAPCVP